MPPLPAKEKSMLIYKYRARTQFEKFPDFGIYNI